MANEGFASTNELGTTYIKPLDRNWKRVTYTVISPTAAGLNGQAGGLQKPLAVFEGCIILGTADEMREVTRHIEQNPGVLHPDAESYAVAIRGVQFRWKDRIIPYEIDPALPEQQRVKDAIAHWEAKTPFRFVKRDDSHPDYIVFVPGNGCASSVGRRGGRQNIILGPNCTTGNCMHEIGHTVGLWHEQSRADRDEYIEIIHSNIIPNAMHNFDQHIADGIDLGEYDYGSLMHYPKTAFARSDGLETIRPKRPITANIGQREGLSQLDIAAVGGL